MPSNREFSIAVIPGDGIGVEVTQAAFAVAEAAIARIGNFSLSQQKLKAGAAYYRETGQDAEPGLFEAASGARS